MDIRRIRIEKTDIKEVEVDVDSWFDEFRSEWLEWENDNELTVEQLREEFIKETAWELALEDAFGHDKKEKIIWEDNDLEVDIFRK